MLVKHCNLVITMGNKSLLTQLAELNRVSIALISAPSFMHSDLLSGEGSGRYRSTRRRQKEKDGEKKGPNT
jgi:hypothetical protein